MLYALKIATRYLTASKAQTALLVLGVAVGVFIFIFMSALIGGLAEFILSRTVGDISHVTIEAEDPDPAVLVGGDGHVLAAIERGRLRTATLSEAATYIPLIEAVPGVVAVSPQISGAGFLARGAQVEQVSVTGLEPGRESAILNLRGYMVEGSERVGSGVIVLGETLADELSLRLGQTVRLQSSTGALAVLTVGGIYDTGNGMIDGSSVYVSLPTARTLFALPQGVTRIEIKLTDLNAADATALRIAALTGLDAVPWTDGAEQLMEALDAQAQTGYFLKSFALVTIVIGVASALLLSTYRRRPEIGIMRAMGAGRGFVIFVFVTQGALVGLMGGLSGAALGYLALLPFPSRDAFEAGTLPMDITQGSYGLAITLTVIGAILASILPARSAARVDPVTAIGQ
ncbi:ABC transporter permease [Lutimaribacter sp. EGI FJ00015]|uniref:ABC transporter permease n=1 Tax=Lutimaribacter degradans TaxID=2945989 RepID=A0ACC5ZSY5_9RHOB|nr:ABC transporter permease [Lutimaribacter sp. EGI FJ00013]MCM2561283.1 ABC transporter permease [Lutimaribacter sp. EGI FJ00013]MCO0611766.1 ABC transporter permease [Lutimaribacter sp. EGI FJ00015]MCO0635112.1 ABC transporter permease [Lutimaribacter sp. EGI FJ00014]